MTKWMHKFECCLCGQRISNVGFAKVAHYRKHVREGLMSETLTADRYFDFPLTERGQVVVEARRTQVTNGTTP
jgi:hypothetical protein